MKTYSQRIKTLEEKILSNKGVINTVVESTTNDDGDVRDFTEIEQETVNLAKSEIDLAKKTIETLKAAQEALGTKITPPAVVKQVGGKERPLADMFVKQATASLMAHIKNDRIENIAELLYAKDADAVEFIKAAAAPADTMTSGWAQELTQTTYGEFLEALRPMSIYAQITAGGIAIPFGSSNSVTFPAEGKTGGLAGQFVGEGKLIPVGSASYTTKVLNRYKLGIISNFTREILRSSIPSIEGLVRNAILKDTAESIDVALLDVSALVPNIRPAGLMNGVVSIPSSGNTVANIVTDVKAIISPIIAAGGNMNGITMVMNSEHLLGLSTVTTAAGTFAFKDDITQGKLLTISVIGSSTITKGKVIAIYSPALASSFDTPEFEVSNSAVIIQATNDVMDSNKPVVDDYKGVGEASRDDTNTPIITTAFQQDLIALRMIMPLSWGMRRDSMVQALSGVAW